MQSILSTENTPFPVASLTGFGGILDANRAWRSVALSDERASAALGLQGSDAEDFTDAVSMVIDNQQAHWIDVDVPVFANRRWARCHIWPAESGDAVHVAVIPLRQSRAVNRSREDIEHVERILEHTADAITIVDKDLSVRFASGIATRWLGASGSAYEGESAMSIVFPDDHALMFEAFAQCLEQPRMSIKARFRIIHESGDLVWVEAIGTNMFDDPAVQGILVTLNDITELVEARAAAEQTRNELAIEKQRYEMLAHFTPTGVFELGVDDNLTFHNERFSQLFQRDGGPTTPGGPRSHSPRRNISGHGETHTPHRRCSPTLAHNSSGTPRQRPGPWIDRRCHPPGRQTGRACPSSRSRCAHGTS